MDKQKNERDGYLDAMKAGFLRAWEHRFLWFWGIFISSSVGGFGFGGENDQETPQLQGDKELVAQREIEKALQFLVDHKEQVFVVAGVCLAAVLIFWAISIVARGGVIMALDDLQNKKNKSRTDFSYVWLWGRKHFFSILKIDLFFMLLWALIIVAIGTPIVFLAVNKDAASIFSVGILAFLIFVPVIVALVFLKKIATIYAVLSGQKILSLIERAYWLISGNIVEALKLFFALIVVSLCRMIVSIALVILTFMGSFILWLSLKIGGAGDEAGLIIAASAGGLMLVAVLILCGSIFALWAEDLWVWWTKKLAGKKEPKKEEQEDGVALTEVEQPAVCCE